MADARRLLRVEGVGARVASVRCGVGGLVVVDLGSGDGLNLVASAIVRNELDRYLRPCIASLLAFADEVRVYDDGSTDGTFEWLAEQDRVQVLQQPDPDGTFYRHEGAARNALLQWTFQAKPTHVLSVDADEFVTNGAAIRAACETNAGHGSWSLGLEEVWKADERNLWIRQDGGWKAQERGIPILWRAPSPRQGASGAWQVPMRQLACGREPAAVRRFRPIPSGSGLLHFGWACESDRAARYARYVEHDGGRFHNRAHLDSIMWTDRRVRMSRRRWPEGIDRVALLERIRREAVTA